MNFRDKELIIFDFDGTLIDMNKKLSIYDVYKQIQ